MGGGGVIRSFKSKILSRRGAKQLIQSYPPLTVYLFPLNDKWESANSTNAPLHREYTSTADTRQEMSSQKFQNEGNIARHSATVMI